VNIIKKLCALLLICSLSLATGLSGCGNKTGADATASTPDSITGEPVNLSYDMLLSSIWVNTENGNILTFTPDMFVDFENNEPADYEGMYYSYSDSEPNNIVNIYLDGIFLKDHWLEFDPERRILSLYLHDDTLASYYIADSDYVAPQKVPSNEWIGFQTQQYDGNDVVEIPRIEYTGDKNLEIDIVNHYLIQEEQRIYEEYLQNKQEYEWIQIKSFPFTSPNYLQVVVTNCEYPRDALEGDLFSINYDRNARKFVSITEAMDMIGLSEQDLLSEIYASYQPGAKGDYIESVQTAGFLIHESAPEDVRVSLLLTLIISGLDQETYKEHYTYQPDGNINTDDLSILATDGSLFDPEFYSYQPDQMDNPLSYQRNK
jgi:hypothetical protein